MPRFGQYLQKAGLLRREQLEEALQHQAVYGGRLGTVLVELGMLSIEQLAESLSDFHKIPLPPRKWLVKPQRSAIARVSRPLVERVRFVPLRLDGTLLHVATLDPRDPRVLDDLRFATGCRIEPYVLPEIWMHDWLFSLFNVPRGIRHIEIAAPNPAPAPAPAAAPARKRPEAAAERPARANAEIERGQARANAEKERAQARVKAEQGGVSVPPPRVQPVAREAAAKTARERAIPEAQPMAHAKTLPEAEASIGTSVRPPPVTVNSLADIAAAMARTDFQKYGVGGMAPAQPVQPVQPVQPAPQPLQAADDFEPPTQNRDLVRALSDGPEVSYEAPSLPPLDEPPTPAMIPPPAAEPPAPVHLIAPAPKPASLQLLELEGELLQVGDRERLIDLALQIGSGFAQRVALFIVQRGLMQGVRCVERGEPRPIEGVLIPLHTDSMLTAAAAASEGMRVDPRERALDARVLQLLGDEGATEVALYPVAVKQRVVNVLYASNGNVPLGGVGFAALGALAEQMGMAYGRLILSKKGAGAA